MIKTTTQPYWIDPEMYPFESKYMQLDSGRMHYIDEGIGEVLLFVHGTPTWSFLYRKLIRYFSPRYRCIAIDHLGFGLSEKSLAFDGTPESHSRNLEEFITKMSLERITLIVHDFGGPIGLGTAINIPEKVIRIIAFNTWLWETDANPEVRKVDRILRSRLGKFLYLYLNFSAKVLLKKAFYDKKKLSRQIHRHYIRPFPDKRSRYGLLRIGISLAGSSKWYGSLKLQLPKIRDKDWLIIWGLKDDFIQPEYLERWKVLIPDAEIRELESGHFVMEEKPLTTIKLIEEFLIR